MTAQPGSRLIAVYDRTLRVMRLAVDKAKLGNDERLSALRRLDESQRRLEATAKGPSLAQFIDGEQEKSHEYCGMSVFGPEPAPAQKPSAAEAKGA